MAVSRPITFVLLGERDRRLALRAVQLAAIGMQVKISKPTRTPEQNGRLHALLTDLAEQLPWPPSPRDDGDLHNLEWWKRRCTLGWVKENKEMAEIVPGLENDGTFAILLPHTSDLLVDQCASLNVWIEAFGTTNGVVFKEPKRQPEPPPPESDR